MIVTEESDSRILLHLPEEFNFKTNMAFQECYRHRDPGKSYAIDFQQVTSFDSSALGMLLLMRDHCGGDKADIHLINCNPRVKKILETAMFSTYFHIA